MGGANGPIGIKDHVGKLKGVPLMSPRSLCKCPPVSPTTDIVTFIQREMAAGQEVGYLQSQ